MRFAVLGTGRIGAAIARDLLEHGARRVVLADADAERLGSFGRRFRTRRLSLAWADGSEPATVRPLLPDTDVVVSALPYALNPGVARATIGAGRSFLDLGGNSAAVRAVLGMHALARRRRCYAVPDCGLAPGLANVLAGEALRRLGGHAHSVVVLVGGIPPRPQGPLRHALFFSFEGLWNEYVSDVETLEDGRIRIRRPRTGLEEVRWRGFGPLEAFRTGGSASTMPATFRRRVRTLEVKTIRHAGHLAAVERLRRRAGPRRFRDALREALPEGRLDLVLLRVVARRGASRVAFETVVRPARGETAMMRATAGPAAAVAILAAQGNLGPPGAKIHERDVPAGPFLHALRRRGIRIREES